MRYHALREKAGERLGKIQLAQPLQGARPEPRIKQVKDRVLDPADILFDRKPLGDFFFGKDLCCRSLVRVDLYAN